MLKEQEKIWIDLLSATKEGRIDDVRFNLDHINKKEKSYFLQNIVEVLRVSASEGHLEIVKYISSLIRENVEKDKETNLFDIALRWAAKKGHLPVAQFLLPLSDPETFNSTPLRWASRSGHIKMVQFLMSENKSEYLNGGALRGACEYGHPDIVKILIPFNNELNLLDSLAAASSNGHIEVVKILLLKIEELKIKWVESGKGTQCIEDKIQFRKMIEHSLVVASIGRHEGIVKILLPLCHVLDVIQDMTKACQFPSLHFLESVIEKENLNQIIQKPSSIKENTKIRL